MADRRRAGAEDHGGEQSVAEQASFTRKDLEAHLIARAWKDEAFKAELMRDPRAVLEREASRLRPGTRLPDNLEIRVVEETPTTFVLVLPPKPLGVHDELTERDLERVAGGARKNEEEVEDTLIADLVTWYCCN